MRSRQLLDALEKVTKAIREVVAVVETMRAEHDPLASHIFISRRHYRNAEDTKGGKRREVNARLSFNTACELQLCLAKAFYLLSSPNTFYLALNESCTRIHSILVHYLIAASRVGVAVIQANFV